MGAGLVDDEAELPHLGSKQGPPAVGERVVAALRFLAVTRIASGRLCNQTTVLQALDRFVEGPRAELNFTAGPGVDVLLDGIPVLRTAASASMM